jgi:hypothetical protein
MILNCSEYPITVDYIYIDKCYKDSTSNKLVLVIVCHGTCISKDEHIGIVLQIIDQASRFSFRVLSNMLRENESQKFKFNKWYNQLGGTSPVFSECKVKLMMLDVVDKNTIICSLSNVFSVNGYVHTSHMLPFPCQGVETEVSVILPELSGVQIVHHTPENVSAVPLELSGVPIVRHTPADVSAVPLELSGVPIVHHTPEDVLHINANCSISLLHAKLGETFYVTYSPPSASFYRTSIGIRG